MSGKYFQFVHSSVYMFGIRNGVGISYVMIEIKRMEKYLHLHTSSTMNYSVKRGYSNWLD